MTSNPLISVIIPNYNHARYLPERIDSVLGQTYRNMEVIILDDCSTDDSREVIERYRQQDSRIVRVVYNEENGGRVFKQWKKGLSLAKGDLLWIAESDDKCEPTFLERLVQCFIDHPTLSLAFSKSLLFNDAGKTWTMDPKGLEAETYDTWTFISRFMSHGCPMLNASACLFSRIAFEKIDDSYTEFRCSGDRMFWTLISEQGDVAVVGDRLNHYRKHKTNTTKSGYERGINQREQKNILDYILKRGYIDKKEYKNMRYHIMRYGVFELLQDEALKQVIYRHWDFGPWEQLLMRLNIFTENTTAKLRHKLNCKSHHNNS